MVSLKHVLVLLALAGAGLTGAGQERGTSAGGPRTDAQAVNLRGQKSELSRKAQGFEQDLAGIDARRKALQEQIAALRAQAGKEPAQSGQIAEFAREVNRLTIDKAGKEAQQRVVRRQLEEVQKQLARVALSAPTTDQETVNLGGQESELSRKAQGLELDLAGIDARRKALQEQSAALRGRADEGSAVDGQSADFARELNRLTIDKAGKEARQQVVRRQLEDVQKRLAQVAPSTPHTDQEAVNLGGQENELIRKAQALELDLAGLDARSRALQAQSAALRGEAGQGAADAGQLGEFTKELNRLAIDKAGQEAQQRVVRRQLEEVQKQLTQALAAGR